MAILTEIIGLDTINHKHYRSVKEAENVARYEIASITPDYFTPIEEERAGRKYLIVNNDKSDPANYTVFIIQDKD